MNATITPRRFDPGVFSPYTTLFKKKRVTSFLQKTFAFANGFAVLACYASPLSAHRGFIGNNHFVLTNEYLAAHGERSIVW